MGAVSLLLHTSTCRTLKSKNVMPSRTSMADFGPTHPMVVPKPPFSFKTANLFRSLELEDAARFLYGIICLSDGVWILSQSLGKNHQRLVRIRLVIFSVDLQLDTFGLFVQVTSEQHVKCIHLAFEELRSQKIRGYNLLVVAMIQRQISFIYLVIFCLRHQIIQFYLQTSRSSCKASTLKVLTYANC